MNYKKIEISDRAVIQEFYNKTTQWFSEYTFSTHVAWNCGGYEYRYRVEDDILFIIIVKLSTGRAIMLKPVSLRKELSPEDFSVIAGKEGIDLFLCIDRHQLEAYSMNEWEKYFKVGEDKGWGNYYYLTQELAELKGGKFSKKRNLIKQFNREYTDDRVEVRQCSEPLMSECARLQEEWYREKGDYSNEMIEREKEALKASFRNFSELGLLGIGLFIDGSLKAFSIYERMNEETIVVHFEKTTRDIKGLPQYFLNQSAIITGKQYKYMNREGDMDDAGLKQSKRSSNPVFIENSFRLCLKKGGE